MNLDYVALFSRMWGIFLESIDIGTVATRGQYPKPAGAIDIFVVFTSRLFAVYVFRIRPFL